MCMCISKDVKKSKLFVQGNAIDGQDLRKCSPAMTKTKGGHVLMYRVASMAKVLQTALHCDTSGPRRGVKRSISKKCRK